MLNISAPIHQSLSSVIKEWIMHARVFILLIGLFFNGWGIGCHSKSTGSSPPPANQDRYQELVFAMEAPTSLDPILSTSYAESEIVLQLFDALLRFDENLSIVPSLAKDWKVMEGGKRYLFQLRSDAHFHHGRKIEAEDVIFSFTRLLSPQWKSADAAHYLIIRGARAFQERKSRTIEGLKALSPDLVEFRLEHPFAPFLSLLALPASSIVPRDLLNQNAPAWSSHPIGTGPFRFRQWKKGDEIILEANPEYFAGAPNLKTLHIKTIPALSANQNFESFLHGEVDFSFVPAAQMNQVLSNPSWKILTSPILRIVFLGINLRNTALQNNILRHQIISLLETAPLIQDTKEYIPLYSLIPPVLLHNSTQNQSSPPKSRLEKGTPQSKTLPRLTFYYSTPPSEERKIVLENIRRSLTSGGFQIAPQIAASMGELYEKIVSGRADLFVMGEIMDFPDPYALLFRLFHSKSEGNLFNYRNSEVDRLLSAAQKTLDEKTRTTIYLETERLILNDDVVFPLFTANYSLVIKRQIKGLNLTPLGFQYLPLRTIWKEK
jgi:oligopeptide transport system substrate-binding protein